MAAESYLAIDLGAGSGRTMLGRIQDDRISLEELHRFPNPGVRALGSLHWDALSLFAEMKQGLAKAASEKPVSLGVDTWGVDFALLDRDGQLVGNPFHYRDERTSGLMQRAFEIVSREEIFESTGLQFMELNSLYQLLAMKDSSALDAAETLLLMPDLFHYWFTGRKACELTDSSTTQFYDPRKKDWARGLLGKLGLPVGMLAEIVEPGTTLGPLEGRTVAECGVNAMQVVAPGSHDTASAVAAVPADGDDWAFLSSGTWSLLGVETPQPFVTAECLKRNFTNEGGVWGTTRLLKNISGLWLLEESRREWSRQGVETSYEQLITEARQAEPFRSVVDVNDPSFVAPGDMPGRIAAWCERNGQLSPETPGQFARTIFESLAVMYRLVLEDLAAITGRKRSRLHIVGGGSRNELLCQYAADACGVEVVAGPVEATALGNVLLQAIAAGRVAGGAQAREIVRRSFEPKRYEPRLGDGWAEAAGLLRA